MDLRQALLDTSSELAAVCPTILRVAHNEEDSSTTQTKGSEHFLKLNESRLGRDLELYGFMGEGPVGWQATLPIFVEEVVLPLKSAAPAAYALACNKLKELGKQIYPPEAQSQWEEILSM
jgi:hypothetical protein